MKQVHDKLAKLSGEAFLAKASPTMGFEEQAQAAAMWQPSPKRRFHLKHLEATQSLSSGNMAQK